MTPLDIYLDPAEGWVAKILDGSNRYWRFVGATGDGQVPALTEFAELIATDVSSALEAGFFGEGLVATRVALNELTEIMFYQADKLFWGGVEVLAADAVEGEALITVLDEASDLLLDLIAAL